VDGQSTDGTVDIIRAFMQQHKAKYMETQIIQDPGISLSYSRHIGYKHSRGDILIFLDGDILITASFRQYLQQELNDSDLIAPLYEILPLDKATKTFAHFAKVVINIQNKSNRLFDPSILTQARIYRRHVLEKIGGYPPFSKFYGEDRIMTALAIRLGFRYKLSQRLKLIKIDDPGFMAYWKKHYRYGCGISRDLSKLGKQLLRGYIIARNISYINLILPIFTLFYIININQIQRSTKSFLNIILMKYLVDLSMLVGNIKGLFEK